MIVFDEPILDTEEKLRKTKKEICLPFQEDIDNILAEKTVLETFRKNTIEHTLLEHVQRQEHPCCIFEYLTNPIKLLEKDFFILYGEVFMVTLKLFNPMIRKDIFIRDKPFQSPLIVFYMSRSIDKHAKAEFNRQVDIQMEGGFKIKMFKGVDQLVYQKVNRIKNTFRNSLEYTKFYTMTSDVTMNDFSFVYLLYIYQALILIIFILHCQTHRIRRLNRNRHFDANAFSKMKAKIRTDRASDRLTKKLWQYVPDGDQ